MGAGDVRLGPDQAWRATRTTAGSATVRITRDGDAFVIDAWGPGAEVAVEQAPSWLGAADDPAGFDPAHPVVRDLHRRFAGLRLTRSGALFDALVPVVMGQKVIGVEARAGYHRLVRALGEPAPGPGGLILLPSSERLAATPYWTFHTFALERRRAEVVISLARHARKLEQWSALPPEAASAMLQRIPGIGPWSAAKAIAVSHGDPDAVPVGDYNLPSTVAWALSGEPRGDDPTMLELLEPFRGQRQRVIRLLMAAGISAPRRGPRLPLRHLERW
jgi:3-methyladenine DNA glycosylase/8-oxoguanine DNA glycosylase